MGSFKGKIKMFTLLSVVGAVGAGLRHSLWEAWGTSMRVFTHGKSTAFANNDVQHSKPLESDPGPERFRPNVIFTQ